MNLRQNAAIVQSGRKAAQNGGNSLPRLVDKVAEWRHITTARTKVNLVCVEGSGRGLACGAKKWNDCAEWSLRLTVERPLFVAIERGQA
jgi:hypothetical protein